MTISTNAAVSFLGTQATAITTAATVANAAFSLAAHATTFTNVNGAKEARYVFTGAFAVAATANSSLALFARPLLIDGVVNAAEPSATFQSTYIGSFPVDSTAGTASQSSYFEGSLPDGVDGQTMDFYLQNNAGQTLSIGAVVKVTPAAIGPKV